MYLEMFLTNIGWFLICFAANQMLDRALGLEVKPKVNVVIALGSVLVGNLLGSK